MEPFNVSCYGTYKNKVDILNMGMGSLSAGLCCRIGFVYIWVGSKATSYAHLCTPSHITCQSWGLGSHLHPHVNTVAPYFTSSAKLCWLPLLPNSKKIFNQSSFNFLCNSRCCNYWFLIFWFFFLCTFGSRSCEKEYSHCVFCSSTVTRHFCSGKLCWNRSVPQKECVLLIDYAPSLTFMQITHLREIKKMLRSLSAPESTERRCGASKNWQGWSPSFSLQMNRFDIFIVIYCVFDNNQ